MPGPVDTRGLQLWVNLKKEFKMVNPNYQEKNPEDVPSTKQNGVFVKGKQSAAVSCSANMAWLAGTGLGSGTKGKLGSAWVSALVGAWPGTQKHVGGDVVSWIGEVGLGHWGRSGLSGDNCNLVLLGEKENL